MNREQYMCRLAAALSRIADEERKNVLEYYNEYFEDAGPEREQEVIQELGSPQKLAAQIKAQCAVKDLEERQAPTVKKGISAIWLIVLGIFAAPIALPLAIAAAAVVFSIVVAGLSILLAVVITAIAVFIAGGVTIVLGFVTLAAAPLSSVFYIGVGVALMGATLLVGALSVFAAGAFFRLLARLLNRGVNKKRKEDVEL